MDLKKEARKCATCGTNNNVKNTTCIGCGAALSG
jgi:hypothetical protein